MDTDSADTSARAALLAGTPEARRRFLEEQNDRAFKSARAAAIEEDRLAARARAEGAHRAKRETELATLNATVQEAEAAYQLPIDSVRSAIGLLVGALVALAEVERCIEVTAWRAKEIATELGDPSRAVGHMPRGTRLAAAAAITLIRAAEEATEARIRGRTVDELRDEKRAMFSIAGFELRAKLAELAGLGGA